MRLESIKIHHRDVPAKQAHTGVNSAKRVQYPPDHQLIDILVSRHARAPRVLEKRRLTHVKHSPFYLSIYFCLISVILTLLSVSISFSIFFLHFPSCRSFLCFLVPHTSIPSFNNPPVHPQTLANPEPQVPFA